MCRSLGGATSLERVRNILSYAAPTFPPEGAANAPPQVARATPPLTNRDVGPSHKKGGNSAPTIDGARH